MRSRTTWILLILLFFVAGAAGSYFFLKHFQPAAPLPGSDEAAVHSSAGGDFVEVRLLLPKDGKLEPASRKLTHRAKSISFAESVIEEFFRAAEEYSLPQNVKILGIYRDANQMLYIDLSDEVRRNFQGDALDEYLLLKGVYESLVSNVQDFQDLKLLVEGKEIETLGGHFYLKYPLKSIVFAEPKSESAPAHD